VAIREADEPIHHCPHQLAHEQLATHRVGVPNNNHLHMEGCEMSLHVLYMALGPTNVAGIMTSMITCENGMGKSMGGVVGS